MILISSLPEHVWKTFHVVARDTGLVPDEPWQEWPTHDPWVTPRGNQLVPNTLLGRSVAKIVLAVLVGIVRLECVKDLQEIPILRLLPSCPTPAPRGPPRLVWSETTSAWAMLYDHHGCYFCSPHDIAPMAAESIRVVGISDAVDEAAALLTIFQDREALMASCNAGNK